MIGIVTIFIINIIIIISIVVIISNNSNINTITMFNIISTINSIVIIIMILKTIINNIYFVLLLVWMSYRRWPPRPNPSSCTLWTYFGVSAAKAYADRWWTNTYTQKRKESDETSTHRYASTLRSKSLRPRTQAIQWQFHTNRSFSCTSMFSSSSFSSSFSQGRFSEQTTTVLIACPFSRLSSGQNVHSRFKQVSWRLWRAPGRAYIHAMPEQQQHPDQGKGRVICVHPSSLRQRNPPPHLPDKNSSPAVLKGKQTGDRPEKAVFRLGTGRRRERDCRTRDRSGEKMEPSVGRSGAVRCHQRKLSPASSLAISRNCLKRGGKGRCAFVFLGSHT